MTSSPLKTAVTALALAGLTACATHPVGPDYQVPDSAVIRQVGQAQPLLGAQDASLSGGKVSDTPLPAQWWKLYQDSALDGLIEKALQRNTDLRQALANLERVQALQDEVSGGKRPRVSVSGGPSYGHVSGLSVALPEPPSTFNYGAGVDIAYQVDLFGQIRRAIEAAQADTDAAQAAVDLARVNVAANTARAYASVCTSGLRMKVMAHSIELQQQSTEISERLHRAGKVGAIDAQRARAQLEQFKADLPPLQALHQNALFQLATLTGEQPQNFPATVATCQSAPRVAGPIPVGDGQALLRRRPDVRQAERQLAQTTAEIGVATADLYPKISLGLSVASVGYLNRLGSSDAFSWSVGPLISWSLPVFNGVTQARIAQSQASAKAALAKFDGTVLNALKETESALSTYARELDRNQHMTAARAESAQVAQESQRLYVNGKSGYLDALDAERVMASADAALAASDAALVDDQLTLFLALGGGWQ